MPTETETSAWTQVFARRGTPQWTSQDETDLQEAIQAGDVPQALLTTSAQEGGFYPPPTETSTPGVGRVVIDIAKSSSPAPLPPQMPTAEGPPIQGVPSQPSFPQASLPGVQPATAVSQVDPGILASWDRANRRRIAMGADPIPPPGGLTPYAATEKLFVRPAVPEFVAQEVPPPQPKYLSPRFEQWAKEYPALDWAFRDFGPETDYLVTKYGPGVLKYGGPVVAALLTHGASLPISLGVPAATTAVTHLASELLQTPAAGTPEAQGQYGPAIQRAGRAGTEMLVAGGAARVIPGAKEGAGLLARGTRALAQSATTGVGAGTGSLIAESFAPSESPLRQAGITAINVAALDTGFKAIGAGARKIVGRSKNLTPEGEKAAETLYEMDAPTPASVGYSKMAEAAEYTGAPSWFGGTRLARRLGETQHKLTDAINNVLAIAKRPRTAALQTAMEAKGWQPALEGQAARANEHAVTSAMYDELNTIVRDQYYRAGRRVSLNRKVAAPATEVRGHVTPGTPQDAVLQQLASGGTLTKTQADQALQVLEHFQRTTRLPTEALQERVRDLIFSLRSTIDDPRFIDPRPLRQTAREIEEKLKGIVSDQAREVLERIRIAPGERLSFQEANNRRSELLEIARGKEPGGSMRAPTPGGQAPGPGEGSRFAPRIQRHAKEAADVIDSMMKAQVRPLGGDIDIALDLTHAAYATVKRKEWIEQTFRGSDVFDPESLTYNGVALLKKIANVHNGEEALAHAITPEVVENLKRFALAMSKSEESSAGRMHTIGGWLRHNMGILGTYAAGAGVGYTTGHPEYAIPFLLLPDTLGYILQSTKLSHQLVVGLRSSVEAKHGWETLGRLIGTLKEEGVITLPESRGGPQTFTQQTKTDPATEYSQALTTQQMTEEEASRYWREQLKPQKEAYAQQQGFLHAFYKQFGKYPGGVGTASAMP